MLKKTILISILSILKISNTFSQVFTHTNPPPSTVCVGSNVTLQFYVTGTGTITPYGSYVVQFGSTIGTCAPITATIPCTTWYSSTTPGTITATIPSVSNGTYFLLVKHSNIAFANSSQPTVSVLNTPATPTVSASGPTAICPSSSVTLTSTGSGPFTWNSGQNTASITVSNPGTYYVTQTNICGSKVSNSVTVSNLSLPTISISSPSVGCGAVSLNSSASSYTSINWSNGQSGTSASANSTGSYFATANNACGSVSSNTVSVTVNSLPIMNLSSSKPSICVGQTDTLFVSGAVTYSWNNGSTNDTIIVSPTNNTTYSVVGTGSNGCTKTATVSVVVNQLPNVNIVSSVVMSCPGSPLNLTASGANTYSWNTGGNTNVIVVYPTVNTTYTVVGTSSGGCSKTSTIDISVYPDYTPTVTTSDLILCSGQTATITATPAFPWVINTYSWSNGSNTNTITVNPSANTTYTLNVTDLNFCTYTVNFTQQVNTCTGISEKDNFNKFQVLPNPNNGEFNIKIMKYNENVNFKLINQLGEVVTDTILMYESNYINLKGLKSGIYTCILIIDKEYKYSEKIVIK